MGHGYNEEGEWVEFLKFCQCSDKDGQTGVGHFPFFTNKNQILMGHSLNLI